MKEDNISSQLGDYDVPFCEQQYINGSCYISSFKCKSFDQLIPPPPKQPQILDIYSLVALSVELQQFFEDVHVFLAFKFSRKTAIKFQKCFCVTLFQEFVTDSHLE